MTTKTVNLSKDFEETLKEYGGMIPEPYYECFYQILRYYQALGTSFITEDEFLDKIHKQMHKLIFPEEATD